MIVVMVSWVCNTCQSLPNCTRYTCTVYRTGQFYLNRAVLKKSILDAVIGKRLSLFGTSWMRESTFSTMSIRNLSISYGN